MGTEMSTSSDTSTRVQWMWNSSVKPFSKPTPDEWKPYEDVENMIIEEAFSTGEPYARLDGYYIDFKHKLQVSNDDDNKQRPIKRKVCNGDDSHVREERFTFTPINPKRPFGGLYGWISPFIKATAKDLKIAREQLPSKDKRTVSMVVEKAALGIIETGNEVGKPVLAAKLAKLLLEKKDAAMEDVWKCCAFLYSMESFLYKKLNEIMRLIGDEEHEQEWRNKVHTLGPFCLLLWDNPFEQKTTKRGTILYRGANLTDDLISSFQDDCSKTDKKPVRSFQSFTSCSRNQAKADQFGNVLFIMEVKHAFTVDLKPFSNYPSEEEELLSPGICFIVDSVKCDPDKNKHMINLSLVQQYRRKLLYIFFLEIFCGYSCILCISFLVLFSEKLQYISWSLNA
jgi:hypothetical protein